MTIVTETMTDINYIAFDSANTVTAYSSVPLDGLPLVVAAADIVAAAEWCEGHFIYVQTATGRTPIKVSRWDWLTLVRDLGLAYCSTAGDYFPPDRGCGECWSCERNATLPVNADGHDFGGAY